MFENHENCCAQSPTINFILPRPRSTHQFFRLLTSPLHHCTTALLHHHSISRHQPADKVKGGSSEGLVLQCSAVQCSAVQSSTVPRASSVEGRRCDLRFSTRGRQGSGPRPTRSSSLCTTSRRLFRSLENFSERSREINHLSRWSGLAECEPGSHARSRTRRRALAGPWLT